MNVVIICSDTFRYDHLGFVGRQQVVTPNLDQLAKESANFADFRVCSFPTIVHRIEVFTGRYTFPFTNWGPLPFQYPVLTEVFKRHGFTTGLVADNPHLMKKKFAFGRGFDFVRDVPGQMHTRFRPKSAPMIDLPCPAEKLDPPPDRLARYRRNAFWHRQQGSNTAEKVFREAINWLEDPPEKFFLWVEAFDPHEPWDAPPQFLKHYPWNDQGDALFWPRSGMASRYSEADLFNMRSLYKAEVTQIDHWTGKFMEHLRERRLLDQTAVIFCSDHGIHLGEHDLIGKLLEPQPGWRHPIDEEVGHIPLLLRHPEGLSAGGTLPGLCQPPDLFVTALDLAGIPPVPWAQGHSLVPRLRGQPGAQRFAVSGTHPNKGRVNCLTAWSDEWCLIHSPKRGLSGSELYHRSSDPMLLQNVIAENRRVAEEHFEQLRSWLDQLGVPPERLRQLLHADRFDWLDRAKHRLTAFQNRWSYQKHYRHYASQPA